jgi:hypothetical protein
VVLSCLRQDFQVNTLTYELTTLESAARCYAATMELGRLCEPRLGLEWLDVRHETLATDFEAETKRICAFLGLSWSDKLSDFAETARGRAVRTPSAVKVREGLTTSGIGRWRDYRKELTPILPELAPWVERFGYPAE